MEYSEDIKQTLVRTVLERTPIWLFNEATREYSTKKLYYYFKRELMREFPEVLSSNLYFSIAMCEAFKPYQVEEIDCTERDMKIKKLARDYKLFPKFHPKRFEIAMEHDRLVEDHNKAIAPQNALIKLYRNIQRKKKVTA